MAAVGHHLCTPLQRSSLSSVSLVNANTACRPAITSSRRTVLTRTPSTAPLPQVHARRLLHIPAAIMSTATLEAYTPSPSKLGVFDKYQRDDVRPKLAEILKDNHERHHCFFNEKSFHNHSAHQILADYSIGADADLLQGHYHYQRTHDLAPGSYKFADRSRYDPYYEGQDGGSSQRYPIEKVDSTNWTRFLGNPRYYWSYLRFFEDQLKSDGLGSCLETLVLSDEANKDGRHMLARFYGGVIHGLIHCGYGAEFGLLPVAAEGLAMTACTGVAHDHLFPPGWEKSKPSTNASSSKRLVPLLKEMLDDRRLSAEALGLSQNASGLPDGPFVKGGKAEGLVAEYADRWSLTASPDEGVDLDAVLADLAWLSVLLLGAVPKLGRFYRHDFFFAHCNNAHIFTKTLVPLLSRESQVTYLRGLARYYLYYFLARGRPSFSTANWAAEAKPDRAVGWDEMFAMARKDADEHLPKALRALYFFSTHLRTLKDDESTRALHLPGLFHDGDGNEETLSPDTDVFLLTARQLYHQQSEKECEPWDFNGFYPDVAKDAAPGRP